MESGDPDAVIGCLSPDVTFRSPVVFKPYEGRDAVGIVLQAVFQVFEDFRYTNQADDGDLEVLLFEARVGDRELQGVDIVRVGDDGLVAELTVLVRPMSAMMTLAEAMRAQLEAAAGSAGN